MPTAANFFSMPPERVTPRDEARFFGRLKTGNATFKRTEHGRLASVDAWLIHHLRASGTAPQTALDIGISSGVTTAEMADAFNDAGYVVRFTGTDRSFEARLVDVAPLCRVLVEPDGHILQYEVVGCAIQPWRRRLDYVDGMIAVRALLHRLLDKRARKRLAAGEGRLIVLVSPRLLHSAAIDLMENNVTIPEPRLTGRFDLVRAANILNRHYFDHDSLLRAVANVRSYLREPGAHLLVVRTLGDTDHHGSLMRLRQDGSLVVVARYGNGSEVEALFTS
jgi:hypothetical protein